ncbi:uncharacterized protein LOC132737932 [Ruditapes philippinarum]|uniref:uncharacterized protein LOC132737932 n=1 Tax=Ruditapes philippinarum TaxID=129788 RepID=UPI00295AD2FD|nr:uncharacterized protein LOC132737932 [Ruditapes philippinarum]
MLKPINDKLDDQSRRLTNLNEKHENQKKTVADLEYKNHKLSSELHEADERIDTLERSLDDLEQYGRRTSIRFHRVLLYPSGESNSSSPAGKKSSSNPQGSNPGSNTNTTSKPDTDKIVLDICKNMMKVTPPISVDDIERSHTIGPTSCQNSNGEIYKNTCGHPCVYCSKIKDAISEDHNYCAKISTVSVGTQTEDITNENVCSKVLFSTPKKKDAAVALSIPSISIGLDDSELRDLSTLEASFRDDSDSTFTCLSDSESDSDQEETDSENTIVSEKKYIVFESALEQLFLALKCPVSHCKCPIDPDDIKRTHIEGSFLSCEIICTAGHTIMNWKSQPMLGKMPASNLLCSAALLFCGQTYTHIAEFAKFMNLGFMSDTTFYRIQRDQVMPVVLDTWQQIQSELLQSVKDSGRPLRLSGDGRCDSPGYNAKYCTYSVMDLETSAILTYVVVQVTETGSSGRMEAEGFRRCMNFLLDEGFVIEVMATDRHV